MRNCIGALLVGVVGILGAAGCGETGAGVSRGDLASRKVRVVTTVGMITDIVQQVGGDRVAVDGLMGPGVDPHLFKASEGDTGRMARADVIFYGGLHLEGKMGEVFELMGKRVRTVAVTSRLHPERDLRPAPPGFEGTHDPHVWFDVTLWMKAVECVRDTLADMDPTHAETYQANARRYLGDLAELHAYVKAHAARVPAGQRVLITAHDAFYYFGHAYGFEVRGLQGVSTASEAATADVQDLARFIAERRIPAIFVESSVPPRNIEAVQAAVRAKGFNVRVGGELFSDAMGSPGTPEGTYVGMVRHNIDTIVKALLGE
jgi:manganese/zinc/iron transport system substrate-binding protein